MFTNEAYLPQYSTITLTRFVGERGSARLLNHVEHMDKLYSIPPPEGAKGPQATSNVVSMPASPKLRYFLCN